MRIRSILPDFYRSEDIAKLDWHTRLVFIGLWSYVDDNGVGRDAERLIASDIFPLEGDPTETLRRVSTALEALAIGGQICRYTDDDKRYLFVVKWDKYQRVQNPGKERFPRPTSENARKSPTLPPVYGDSTETLRTGEGEKGRRGEVLKALVNDVDHASNDVDVFGFDEFWLTYPRKQAKQAARAAWSKALKRASASAIISGAMRYRDDPNREPEFTAHATSWLNAGRWDDEPLPARRATQDTRSRRTESDAQRLIANAAAREAAQDRREIGA